MKKALVAGATGLIGSYLLDDLLADTTYERVIVISRTPVGIQHSRLENIVTPFEDLSLYKARIGADDVFCCLGTTMKKAGTKDAFMKVDKHYPLLLAQISKEMGAKQFLLVSAMGANDHSFIFYNKVKGELELEIRKLKFQTFHIFRPSLLFGPRVEKRAGEKFAIVMTGWFGFAIPKNFKGIEAKKVALAMVHAAQKDTTGVIIHTSGEMQEEK